MHFMRLFYWAFILGLFYPKADFDWCAIDCALPDCGTEMKNVL